MTNEPRQTDLQITSAENAALLHRLDDLRGALTEAVSELRTGLAQVVATQVDTRADIAFVKADVARVEVVATEARDQSRKTNGRVTVLELWKAEVKGISQGVGGAGRLLLYMLGAAATTSGLIVTLMKFGG